MPFSAIPVCLPPIHTRCDSQSNPACSPTPTRSTLPIIPAQTATGTTLLCGWDLNRKSHTSLSLVLTAKAKLMVTELRLTVTHVAARNRDRLGGMRVRSTHSGARFSPSLLPGKNATQFQHDTPLILNTVSPAQAGIQLLFTANRDAKEQLSRQDSSPAPTRGGTFAVLHLRAGGRLRNSPRPTEAQNEENSCT